MYSDTETYWALDTADGHKIHGVTNSCGETDRAIIIVHGLTGHANEYHIKTAAHHFANQGYDTHRIWLYTDEDKGRRLHECTLKIHAGDIRQAIEEKLHSYNKRFGITHSYGGPSIMIAMPKELDALSLWDPSFDLRGTWDAQEMRSIGDELVFDWGVNVVISKTMMDEGLNITDDECLKLSEDLHKPIQVITATEYRFINHEKSWHSAGHPDNERQIVEGDHCFWKGHCLRDVLAHTEKFFARY